VRLRGTRETLAADQLAAYVPIEAAKKRIGSSRACQDFFHGEGERALENTRFSVQ